MTTVTLHQAREITDRFVRSAVEPVGPRDVVITHSEVDTFRQCPLKHELAYRRMWTKQPAPGSALGLGTLWHNVMETYYTHLGKTESNRRTPATVRRASEAATAQWLSDGTDEQELVQWMLDGYTRYWGAEHWEVLAVEKVGRVRIYDPHTERRTKYVFMFKVDLLVWDRGRIVLVDHKSASNFSRPNEVAIADQFGAYTWALHRLGVPVWQTVRNDARTQRNVGDRDGTKPMPLETRFQRVPTYRTDTELQSLATDLLTVARVMHGPRRPPVYSSPDPNTCTWKCPFFDAHLLARKGVPIDQTLRFTQGMHQAERKHDYYPADLVEYNQKGSK